MQSSQSSERPLQSWKEIAAYLERDVRTASRWEKAGLPVRRHTDGKRSSVYAYPSEIEAWRAARPTQELPQERPPHWRQPTILASVVAAAAAVALLTYGPILNPKSPLVEAAEDAMRSEQVWAGDAVDKRGSLLPGSKLLYVNWFTGDLWLRDLATGESRQVTDKGKWINDRSYAETGTVSPDGKRIASGWYNDDGGVYELRVSEMKPHGETDNGRAIVRSDPDKPSYVEAIDWLTNTRSLFVQSIGNSDIRLATVDVESGSTTVIKKFDWGYPSSAVVSPDRNWIAFGLPSTWDETQDDIHVLAADGSEENVVVRHRAQDVPIAWTPDGSHLLFSSERMQGQSLWAVAVADGKAVGEPRLLNAEFSPAGTVGLSSEGTLYYVKSNGSMDVYEARIDVSTGRLIEPPTKLDSAVVGDNFDPLYSPNGRWLAYLSNRSAGSRYGSTSIVVRELVSGEERNLALGLAGVRNLDWSPDSESLLFRARPPSGPAGIYRIGLRDDSPTLLFRAESEAGPVNARNIFWMPDGRSVHYRDAFGTDAGHWIYDLATGEKRKIFSAGSPGRANVSPDGNRLAVVEHLRKESVGYMFVLDLKTKQQHELWRMALPDGGKPPAAAAWTRDSNTILYWRRVPRKGPFFTDAVLWTVSADGGEPQPTELSAENLTLPVQTLSLHPDGERLVFSAGSPGYEIWKLSNFLSKLDASDQP